MLFKKVFLVLMLLVVLCSFSSASTNFYDSCDSFAQWDNSSGWEIVVDGGDNTCYAESYTGTLNTSNFSQSIGGFYRFEFRVDDLVDTRIGFRGYDNASQYTLFRVDAKNGTSDYFVVSLKDFFGDEWIIPSNSETGTLLDTSYHNITFYQWFNSSNGRHHWVVWLDDDVGSNLTSGITFSQTINGWVQADDGSVVYEDWYFDNTVFGDSLGDLDYSAPIVNPKVELRSWYDDGLVLNADPIVCVDNENTSFCKTVAEESSLNNGFVHLDIEGVFNVTVYSPSYFYYTVSEVNFQDGLIIKLNLSQSQIEFLGFDNFSGLQVLNFSVNDSVVSVSTLNGSAFAYLDVGEYVFSYVYGSYSFLSDAFNVSALDNFSVNVSSLFNFKLNFSAVDNFTGSSVSNFSVNLSGGGVTRVASTTSGLLSFNISLGLNYSSLLDASGYAFGRANHSNLSGDSSVFSFSLFTAQSLLLNYFNVVDLSVVSVVEAQFIGASNFNVSTSNGSLFVPNLLVGEYSIVSNSDGFVQNSYIVRVVDNSFSELNVYLQPENLTSLILLSVKDVFGTPLSGAEITIQRYVNNGWISEQVVKTDFQGRSESYFVLSTVFYNFLISYGGESYFGVVNGDATKKVIYAEDVASGLNFFINLLDDSQVGSVIGAFGVPVNLSFVDLSGNLSDGYFRYYFDDPNNVLRSACLVVVKGLSQEVVCGCDDNVVSSESGVLSCFVNQSGLARESFWATGFIDGMPVVELSKSLGLDERLDWGFNGYLWGFLLVVACFFLFINSPALAVWVGTGALALLAVLGVVFQDVGFGVMIVLLVVAYLVANIRSDSGVNG